MGAMITKTTLIIAAAIIATPAAAAFTEAAPPKLGDFAAFECAIVKTTESYQRNDADPFYKIVVSIKSTSPISLEVRHVAASGLTRVRDEQYTDSRMFKTPDKYEYIWTGTLISNREITMRGRIWHDVNGNWYYAETQYKRSAQSYAMVARCHEVNDM